MRPPVALTLAVGLLSLAGCSGHPRSQEDSAGPKVARLDEKSAMKEHVRAETRRPAGGVSRKPLRRIGPAPSAPEEKVDPSGEEQPEDRTVMTDKKEKMGKAGKTTEAVLLEVAQEEGSTLPKANGKALSPAPRKTPKGSGAKTSPEAPKPAKKPAGKKSEAGSHRAPGEPEKDSGQGEKDDGTGAAAKTGSAPGASSSSKSRNGGSPAEAPRSVKLPEAGDISASQLYPLLEDLTGLKVVLDEDTLREAPIRITEGLAGQRVSQEELTILLAAYGIYLFPHDRADGSVLVVTANPRWTPPPEEAPRFTKIFQVRARDFEAARKEVEAYVAKRNQALSPKTPPITIAADGRTGRIIARAPSEEILKGVEETIGKASKAGEKKASSMTHLYSYSPTNRRASDLQAEVLDSLDDAQKARVTIVVPRGRNVLMIQSTEEMYGRILAILQEKDARPAPNRVESVGGSSGV
jgi:hypothetical protein